MLRHRMGLDDATNVATEFPPEISFALPELTATIATVTHSIHRIERIISSPPRTTLPFTKSDFDTGSDDDFIVQDWTEIPKTSMFDIPLSVSGSEPTRQHVVEHPNSEIDAVNIASRLPAIIEALNLNNVLTASPSFILDPEAVVHLSHVAGTEPKYIPQCRSMPERKRVAVRSQITK